MPRVSKNKRAAKERAKNYCRDKNGRHIASSSHDIYPMGENYSSPPKTAKIVNSEATLEVEEVCIYDDECALFEEFVDSLADAENESCFGMDSMNCDPLEESKEEDYA